MSKPLIDRSGISYINRMVGTSMAPACVFFLAAWRVDLIQAWVYFGLFMALSLTNIALLVKCNMELLNERGKSQTDVHGADKIIVPLYLLFTHVISPAVAGMEVGRLHAGYRSLATVGVGIALMALSGVLENWATYANRFYERGIRLQKDRGQTVVTNGPYAIIRHPGYLSYILRFAALPLAIGSMYSLLPIAAGILLMIIRTNVEDALLMANLAGYKEYSRSVRFRLLPPVW
jgi:protein-S-isoprenylcysteine O-methyltransferase Ste14